MKNTMKAQIVLFYCCPQKIYKPVSYSKTLLYNMSPFLSNIGLSFLSILI